ncbi:hypothetical protein OO012_09115 [Rhodobacteraceae bacterium KMM 6894]|nr:hypothetical protein [Rhodobacteraceae bacterium KMM 6894]
MLPFVTLPVSPISTITFSPIRLTVVYHGPYTSPRMIAVWFQAFPRMTSVPSVENHGGVLTDENRLSDEIAKVRANTGADAVRGDEKRHFDNSLNKRKYMGIMWKVGRHFSAPVKRGMWIAQHWTTASDTSVAPGLSLAVVHRRSKAGNTQHTTNSRDFPSCPAPPNLG